MNMPTNAALLQLQDHYKCKRNQTKELLYSVHWLIRLYIKGLHTFLSKASGSNGNRTNPNKSWTDGNLSRKRCSGAEFIISSSTTSHPYNSFALKPHIKIALRTFSSDVTVKSGCCKIRKHIINWFFKVFGCPNYQKKKTIRVRQLISNPICFGLVILAKDIDF